MNLGEMKAALADLVKDSSDSLTNSFPDLINDAVRQIAEEVRFPELRQVSAVTTSITTYYVNMPATFSSRLIYAGNSDGEYKVLDTLDELIRWYPSLDDSGDIEYVVCEGGILYYQPIPTVAETVTCIGYHLPDLLTLDGDTPSFIPSYLHRAAIVNRVAAVAYNIIEDGVDDAKVNTRVFNGLAEQGLNGVRAYISRRRPVLSKSNWSA